MGTKVQCKSYSPVYYAMRDLNEDANSGSWPLYYEDKILNNGQYYNCFLPRSRTDGYSDYDKEILKQTMIEHETVFRNQVYELHRLYRTQRDLMNEVRRKELQNYQRSAEASQSSPFSSQTPSEDAKRMWQIRNFPLMNSSCSIPSTSGANNMQSPLNFIKESSIQASLNSTRNGGILKDHALVESKSKSKQVMTRGFDLQLPASEYLDNEVEQIKEEAGSHVSVKASYPLETNCSVVAEIDFKLSLGSHGSPSFRGDASESISCSWNKHGLADLNQPVQVQETTAPAPAPVNFLGPAARYGEVQGKDLPAKPNSLYSGFPRDFIRSTQRDRNIGSHINDLRHLENGERRERPCNLEVGQSSSNFNSFLQGFRSEKLPTQSEPVQIDSRKAHEPPGLPFCDYNKREPWREEPWRESTNRGSEISERSQNQSSYNYLGPVVKPCMPSPYPNVPQPDANSEFPSVSSWMKPINKFSDKSIEVQAVSRLNSSAPFFKGSSSSVQNTVPLAEKWHLGSNSRSNSSCGKEISFRNGFFHGSQSESNASQNHFPSGTFDYPNCSIGNNSAMEHLENHSPVKYFRGSDCRDVKSAKDMMNLNLTPHNGFRDGVVSRQDIVIIDKERKNEDPPRGLPWLRAKLPPCNGGTSKGNGFSEMGLDSLPGCSHQNTSNSAEIGKVLTPSFFQQITSAAETQRIKVDNCQDNQKILGVPIFDKSRISMDQQSFSLSSNPCQYPSEVEVIQNNGKTVCSIDLSREPVLPVNVVADKGHEKEHSGFKNHFNLNVCINEEETSSITCVPESKVKKIALDIDLEAPAPEALEDVCPDGDSLTSQTVNLVQASQTEEDPLEELARMASEAIVMMSCLSIHNNLEDSTSPSSEASLKDALTWFADVVSSNMGDPESEAGIISSRGKGNSDREESPGELDYFELMTLQLAETNLEDYCSQIWVPEIQKEEETGIAATTLLTRRRRGQARRGRQRRDFQRDILPGLASLSRHEVTEDMQTFGGLMRATGHCWQTGSTRRNAGRNGATRGRKPRSQTPVTTVVLCSPPRQQQPNNSEVVGIEEGSLKGWGKTTRRPRRQRFPAGTPLALTQV